MRSTMKHRPGVAKAELRDVTDRAGYTRVQYSESQRCSDAPLDGVRASYSIEGDTTIGAVLVAMFCAGMAMGGALVLGAVRSLGWR